MGLVCEVSCLFVTFPYGVLSQMWYMIVLIPDLCLLHYFFKRLPAIFSLFYLHCALSCFQNFLQNMPCMHMS